MTKYSLIWVCKWPDNEYPEATGVDYYGISIDECKKVFLEEIWKEFTEDDPFKETRDKCLEYPIQFKSRKNQENRKFTKEDEIDFEEQAWHYLTSKRRFHVYPIMFYFNEE